VSAGNKQEGINGQQRDSDEFHDFPFMLSVSLWQHPANTSRRLPVPFSHQMMDRFPYKAFPARRPLQTVFPAAPWPKKH